MNISTPEARVSGEYSPVIFNLINLPYPKLFLNEPCLIFFEPSIKKLCEKSRRAFIWIENNRTFERNSGIYMYPIFLDSKVLVFKFHFSDNVVTNIFTKQISTPHPKSKITIIKMMSCMEYLKYAIIDLWNKIFDKKENEDEYSRLAGKSKGDFDSIIKNAQKRRRKTWGKIVIEEKFQTP